MLEKLRTIAENASTATPEGSVYRFVSKAVKDVLELAALTAALKALWLKSNVDAVWWLHGLAQSALYLYLASYIPIRTLVQSSMGISSAVPRKLLKILGSLILIIIGAIALAALEHAADVVLQLQSK